MRNPEDTDASIRGKQKSLHLTMGQLLFVLFLAISISSKSSASPQATEKRGTPNPPALEQAATQYLKKLAQSKIFLTNDTAISKHSTPLRRRAIKEKLQFFSKTQLDANDTFSVESTKVLGDFAGVIVKAQNPSTPLSIRMHGIALIKRQQQWLPAPIPGSFSNTGYGYNPDVEKDVKSLEFWMAQQSVTHESKALKTAMANLINAVKKEEAKGKFDTLNSKQAVSYFIEKCRQKNLPAVLACLGVGSGELETSLTTTIKTITKGFETTDIDNAWQLVSNPAVIALTLGIDAKTQDVAAGFWNPLTKPHAQVIYFSIRHTNGKTWIALPPYLKLAMLPENDLWLQSTQRHHADERKLSKKLVEILFKKIPRLTFPKNPQNISNAFLSALDERDFTKTFQLLPNQGDYFGVTSNQKNSLTELSNLWQTLDTLKKTPHQNQPLITESKLALLPIQYSKIGQISRFDTTKIWFFKDAQGWHIIPENTLSELKDSTLDSQKSKLESAMRASEKKQHEAFSKKLLSQVTLLTPPLELPAPDDSTAKKVFTAFRSALRSKSPISALSQCAILKETDADQILKNFSYALKAATDQTDADFILKVSHSGPWAGISFRTYSQTSKTFDYPLYLIVNTPNGPKILFDTDLRYATNKGRTLLNNRNWKKLEALIPENSLAHIKTIFGHHETAAKADIKTHDENTD